MPACYKFFLRTALNNWYRCILQEIFCGVDIFVIHFKEVWRSDKIIVCHRFRQCCILVALLCILVLRTFSPLWYRNSGRLLLYSYWTKIRILGSLRFSYIDIAFWRYKHCRYRNTVLIIRYLLLSIALGAIFCIIFLRKIIQNIVMLNK